MSGSESRSGSIPSSPSSCVGRESTCGSSSSGGTTTTLSSALMAPVKTHSSWRRTILVSQDRGPVQPIHERNPGTIGVNRVRRSCPVRAPPGSTPPARRWPVPPSPPRRCSAPGAPRGSETQAHAGDAPPRRRSGPRGPKGAGGFRPRRGRAGLRYRPGPGPWEGRGEGARGPGRA